LLTPLPSLPLNHTEDFWGSQSQKLLLKGHKNFFPSRFTILRFEIVNVYSLTVPVWTAAAIYKIQGQANYDFTIFTIVTTFRTFPWLLLS